MKKVFISLLLFSAMLYGHEGHEHMESLEWLKWTGAFHLLFLHFPIALITMTAIAELLSLWRHSPQLDAAARFMLLSAAVLSIPTVLLGLLYRYTATYNGLLEELIDWHMGFGIATALFALLVLFIREYYGMTKAYGFSLFILFLLVSITGFIGGYVTFGPEDMLPPL